MSRTFRILVMMMALGLMACGSGEESGTTGAPEGSAVEGADAQQSASDSQPSSRDVDLPAPCGDGVCEASEDEDKCPEDCASYCGNGACEGDEVCAASECEADAPCTTCPQDCCPVCGDGICEFPEAGEMGVEIACPEDCEAGVEDVSDTSDKLGDIGQEASDDIEAGPEEVVDAEESVGDDVLVLPEDAQSSDDSIVEVDSGLEDTLVVPDDVDEADVMSDDTALEDDASEDVMTQDSVISEACDPEGTWVLETTTAALPGEGCGPNGEPAQGPNTKTFIVTKNADGSLTGVVPEITQPDLIPTVSVTQLPQETCSFLFTLSVSVYFPSLGGEEPSTAYLDYAYTVALADGGVHGAGSVQTATIFESGEVQQQCTEAITVGGTFTPLGG